MKRRLWKRAGHLGLVCLLAAALLCSCGQMPVSANSEPDKAGEANPAPTPTHAPTETPAPTPTPEAQPTSMPAPTQDPKLLAERRLSEAKDGFVWDEGFLQAIDDEGNIRTDCYVGVLHMGKTGRYTSGSMELDQLVAKVIRENTNHDMTRMEMLRAVYDYTVESIRYVGMVNYDCSTTPAHGVNGWMPKYAIKSLKDGIGNCYCYAAAFAALARGLGYQAFAVGGVVGGLEDPHGWVQILDDEGNVWMNDPEIEYRFGQQWELEGKPAPDLFYKAPDEIGGETGLDYYAQCDPYAAEAEEAEARMRGTETEVAGSVVEDQAASADFAEAAAPSTSLETQ